MKQLLRPGTEHVVRKTRRNSLLASDIGGREDNMLATLNQIPVDQDRLDEHRVDKLEDNRQADCSYLELDRFA